MANYVCATTSNWFKVKNEEEFLALMDQVYTAEDSIEVVSEEEDGQKRFSFCCYSDICGIRNAKDDEDEDCDESSYDEFIAGLQSCVADDDAVIIFQSGHEKLRYVDGYCEVITSKEYRACNLHEFAAIAAKELLGHLDFRL